MNFHFGTNLIYLIFSVLCLLFIMYIDLFLSLRNRVSYLTNGQHVALFTIPFMLAFIFFILFAVENDMVTVTVLMFYLLIGTFIYLLNSEKIILRSADLSDVVDKLTTFLIDKEKSFRVYKTGNRTLTVEVNNYKDALTIRETEHWVEIHNHIQHDDDLLNEMNRYFKKNVRSIKHTKKHPNFYFIIIQVFIAVLFYMLINFINLK